jgi:D-3-phosphoglycerate dehydrogenase
LEAQERIGAEVARKFVEYSDVGSTTGAVNFPQVQLSPRPKGTRFIQVQRNLPGELGRLNEVFARHKVNIGAQTYQTAGELGYVVLDADGGVTDAEAIVKDIRALPGTVRARMLYRRT